MKNHDTLYKRLRQYLVLLFGTVLTSIGLSAQSFPVEVTVQPIGPAPTQLATYADATQAQGPLRVTLVLNDLTLEARQVRLQLSFQGGGINFESVPNPVGAQPLTLEGGIPLTLTAPELAPYFRPASLVGIAPSVYGAPLPEGSYQICFEVFDQLTGSRLSQRSCTSVFIFQNRPPMLVLPANGSQMEQREPQSIVFQWTPRQLNVTNVEYELSLVELWDTQVDPQAAFLSSPPIFTTTTTATSYLYGPADPLLLPNRAYGWRVRAKPAPGADDVGLFQNQGDSEIFSFVHLAPCELPTNLRHEVKGSHQANILWDDPSTEVPEFTVRYRPKGGGGPWYTNRTSANWTTIWALGPGTPYEYQLKKDCGMGESNWSRVRQFTTALETLEEDLYQCGISPDIDIANQDPLPELHGGQQFVAGDFTVTATTVAGGNGYYSGLGFVRVPYLGNIKLAVRYTNILLNTDRQLVQGIVVTEFDPSMRNIVDTQDVATTVVGIVDTIRELLESFTGTPEQIQQLQEENQQQETYVDQLLADETIPQNVRDELAANHNAYNASSQSLIDEATQGGPNPDGYDTANQLQALNNLETSIERAESYHGEEIAFEEGDSFELNVGTETDMVIYVSPAGVPVPLPGPNKVTPRFYEVRENGITTYGSLIGFTIKEGPEAGIYQGYRRKDRFTGYKISKDSVPYVFADLPNTDNIQVRTVDGGGCLFLILEGQYQTDNTNTTGNGNLSLDWDRDITWEVLYIEEQNYTTCLPALDYESFTEYFVGTYNPFGNGGFLRKVIAADGSVAHIYSITDLERGWLVHFQYNTGNGQWEPIEVPEYDVDTAAALDYLIDQVFSSAAGHLVLDVLGTVPAFGEPIDLVNGIWYTLEGDAENATVSFASTIPLVYATVGKYLGKVVKLADGKTVVVKFSKETTQQLVDVLKRLDLNAEQLKRFGDDLVDKDFAEAIAQDPQLVDSWKILFKDGDAALELVRRNPENLEKLSKFISETGMEESKLISSFGNTKNPQKWIDMKIPESELDAVYDGFNNSPPVKFEAWTPEHKAQRWQNHKAGNPDADYKAWSNQYDGNIDKAIAANKGVDNFYSGLSGNVVREKSFPDISITTSEGTKNFTRRLDIVDEDAFKGIEFKEYSSGRVYRSPDIRREYALDGKILKDDLLDEVEWIFKGCEPSAPLRTDLEALGIKVTLLP